MPVAPATVWPNIIWSKLIVIAARLHLHLPTSAIVAGRREPMPGVVVASRRSVALLWRPPLLIKGTVRRSWLYLPARSTVTGGRREAMPGIVVAARCNVASLWRASLLIKRTVRCIGSHLPASVVIFTEAVPAIGSAILAGHCRVSAKPLISCIALCSRSREAAVSTRILRARIIDHALLSRGLLAERPLRKRRAAL